MTRMKQPQMTRLDLASVTTETLAAGRIPEGVKVVRDFPEEKLSIKADREQLRVALQNIIVNAVEAMDGNGILTVCLRRTGDRAELSFADTGPGIPVENLDRIFEPLFTTKPKGVGFGLSTTRLIFEKHGGTITARPGKGATFVISLPLATADA